MSADSIEELAASAKRRRRVLDWGSLVGGALVSAWLIVEFGGLGLAAAGILTLGYLFDFFTFGGTVVYETTKAPEEVRAEFTGPQPPLFALHRHNAERVTDLERGFAWEQSGWIRTAGGRIEAAETDGPLELRLVQDDEHVRTVTVSVEPRGSITRVTARMEREANVALVLLDRLLDPLQRRAMARQGYVRVRDDTSVR